MNCPSCGVVNDPSHRFCNACGAAMAQVPTCRACGTALPAGSKFCTHCGTTVAAAPEVPQGPGYVVDGEWHRAPGELVRRVPGEALRSAFGRLVPGVDWDAFLRGTLVGKVVDALVSRSIRVPLGSVGVVTRDGVVVKILPPGEQTTPGLLRDLFAQSDLAGATAAAVERWFGGDRIALYLVDRRPVPVSFSSEVAASTGTRTLSTTALVAVGADRDALTAFLGDVVADRESLSSEDLYVRFRAEIERAVGDALRARPNDWPGAERVARDALRGRFTARTGLSFDLTIAPRHTVHRLDLVLGTTAAAAACGSCGAPVRAGARFCTTCGTACAPVDPGEVLATSDGASVDVDLVLSVQGDQAPSPPTGVLRAAAARHVRGVTWAELQGSQGLSALEDALREVGSSALGALGYRLVALELLDVRSQGHQWALGARAAIEQAKGELAVGREWLAVRDDQLALEGLANGAATRSERVRRDAVFAARELGLEDARRTAAVEQAERDLARSRAEAEHSDAVSTDARAHARAVAASTHRSDLDRAQDQRASEQLRLRADDRAYEEERRREVRLAELKEMAALDADIAEREQRHKVETMDKLAGQTEAQMIAMQAAELADKAHGAAFADALGKLVDGDAARRERERADRAAEAANRAVVELAKAAIESNAKVAAAKAAVPNSCPTCGQVLPPGARFCGGCGTGLA
ncbi:MAG: zinc ribbon domain-containing protein [Myxococcota bacterium]